jgi:hypothetical protein
LIPLILSEQISFKWCCSCIEIVAVLPAPATTASR